MKLSVELDIDIQESGYTEDDLKDNIVDFVHDLIINGAENEEVALTLLKVSYEI